MASNSYLNLFGLGDTGTDFQLSDEDQQKINDAKKAAGLLASLYGPDSTDSTAQAASDASAAPMATDADAGLPATLNSTDGAGNPQANSPPLAITAAPSDDGQIPQGTILPDSTDQGATSGLLGGMNAPSADTVSTAAAAAPSLLNSITSGSDDSSDSGGLSGILNRVKNGLTNMSPEASQALIATGLGILSHNDGSHNALQTLAIGGSEGLNAYTQAKQLTAANQLAQAKMQIDAAQARAEIGSKNATTSTANFALAQKQGVQQLIGQINSGQISINDPAVGRTLAGFGVPTSDIMPLVQNYMPELGTPKEFMGANGVQMVQDQTKTGAPVGQPYAKAAAPTAVSPGTNLVNTQTPGTNGQGSTVYSGGPTEAQQGVYQAQATTATTEQQAANKNNQLLKLVQDPSFANGSAGWSAQLKQAVANQLGTEDPNVIIRQMVQQDMQTGVFANLPAGSRMDQKEFVAFSNALANGKTASPTQLANYLATSAAAHQAKSTQAQATADYLSSNNYQPGPLGQDTTIAGTPVKAGTTQSQYVQSKVGNTNYYSGVSKSSDSSNLAGKTLNPQALASKTPAEQAQIQAAFNSKDPKVLQQLANLNLLR